MAGVGAASMQRCVLECRSEFSEVLSHYKRVGLSVRSDHWLSYYPALSA